MNNWLESERKFPPNQVAQEDKSTTCFNLPTEFDKLKELANTYASHTDTLGAVYQRHMNNSYIDANNAKPENGNIYVHVPWEVLKKPDPLIIKGLSDKPTGPPMVITVTDIPNVYSIQIKVKLQYTNGGAQQSTPNHVLWKFGVGSYNITTQCAPFMESILAPNFTTVVLVKCKNGKVKKAGRVSTNQLKVKE